MSIHEVYYVHFWCYNVWRNIPLSTGETHIYQPSEPLQQHEEKVICIAFAWMWSKLLLFKSVQNGISISISTAIMTHSWRKYVSAPSLCPTLSLACCHNNRHCFTHIGNIQYNNLPPHTCWIWAFFSGIICLRWCFKQQQWGIMREKEGWTSDILSLLSTRRVLPLCRSSPNTFPL